MSAGSVYLRDLDGTGSLHVCAEGDPGAIEFVPAAIATDQAERDRLANKWLLSRFNYDTQMNKKPMWNPEQCTAEEYIAHIRTNKPFALQRAYEMADWALAQRTAEEVTA